MLSIFLKFIINWVTFCLVIVGDGADEESADDELEDEDDGEKEELFLKRAKQKDCFAVCRELGLHGLAKKFGLTPQQFGENLRDNYQRHEVRHINTVDLVYLKLSIFIVIYCQNNDVKLFEHILSYEFYCVYF